MDTINETWGRLEEVKVAIAGRRGRYLFSDCSHLLAPAYPPLLHPFSTLVLIFFYPTAPADLSAALFPQLVLRLSDTILPPLWIPVNF